LKSMDQYSCGEWLDADKSSCRLCDGTEASIEREPLGFGYLQEVEEVNLDSLQAKDYLIIQTENSLYRFTMLEPERRCGLLSGGALGSNHIRAKLVATLPMSSPKIADEIKTVREHSRAIFSVSTDKEAGRLITSEITKLTQVTGRPVTTPLNH
jgi:hypothetical protein